MVVAVEETTSMTDSDPLDLARQESRARALAKKHGLIATKSRWRHGTVDNHGGFQIVDRATNTVVGGERYDLTAAATIEFIEHHWGEVR